jgi:threonine dehydrogenase-like Zn-dependent dehydrogenase
MRATLMYRAGDVRVENVPDARLTDPSDALITINRACVCGSDLWPYKLLEPQEKGRRQSAPASLSRHGSTQSSQGHDQTLNIRRT